MRLPKIFIVFYFLLLEFFPAVGQTLDELNSKRKQIEENINKINNLIQETSKKKNLTTNNLVLIEERIKYKSQLVTQLDNEISYINDQILNSQKQIDSLEIDLGKKRSELANILNKSFRNKDRVMFLIFIFSSNSFNQAYARAKYYKQIVNYQNSKILEIKSSINKNLLFKQNLQNNFKLLKIKQIERQNEVSNLMKDRESYNLKVKQIKQKESELLKELKAEKKKNDAINSQIRKLIEEEARRVKNDSKSKEVNILLSKQFKENIGKLPSPVKDGVITSPYGESNHPFLKGVKIKNNGVDVTVSKNSNVYCIFDGEVRTIFSVPLSGFAIIIRHGNFLTVYSNLSKLNVKVGEKVKTNQIIGQVSTDNNNVGILHFEIWNERNSENPTLWISGYKNQ